MNLQEALKERFLRYTAISSQSDDTKGIIPSSQGQWTLAHLLAKELKLLGLIDINISEYGVVTAHLNAHLHIFHDHVPSVGWVCHMDTVDVGLSDNIHAHVVHYTGGDLCQNEQQQIYIRLQDHPELQLYNQQDILVSDGTSVLGADNKAAIANVMCALEYLNQHPEIEHGPIYIAFVPDEEIGLLGVKKLDFDRFPVDYAYTIDCCAIGEVVYQTFNASSATLHIQGVSAHPMAAKGNLVNPLMVAHDFIALLPRDEMPENTEKTEGFIWPTSIHSNPQTATVQFAIRDHNLAKFNQKKRFLEEAVQIIQQKHPKSVLSLSINDTYSNIIDALTEDNKDCINRIYKVLDQLSIPANTIAMRGGTDGSFLSSKGILTPNYFTGAHNFHSSAEFLPLSSFEKSCFVTIALMSLDQKV